MLITEFFANREILITGGTGYLGKALIEKLLRDCPKIKVIYILLRGKKSLSIEQRLADLRQNKAFCRVRQECPEMFNKLRPIESDSLKLGLGLKPSDLELLKNVSIIFHMAANVKFDDPLRSSILLNTRGTYELIKIAEKLKNLVVFVHCSTAYCNPFEYDVEEKVYETPVDWRKTIKMAETFDEYTLNTLCMKYTGNYPNTYTFTKNLSEQIIQEYASKLPMLLFRPSIVSSALKEPMIAWTDNMNGPIAIMVGLATGIIPICFVNKDLLFDWVPIDTVTKLTIVAAYKRGIQMLKKENIPNQVEVINCASGETFPMTANTSLGLYLRAVEDNPMENCLWRFDNPRMTLSYYNFLLHLLLINVPFSLIIDNVMRLMGRKPLLLTLTRRVIYSVKTVYFFALKEYNMITTNMFNLENFIPESEIETFGTVQDSKNVDYFKFMERLVCEVKENFLNEPMQASAAAHSRYKILYILNKTIKLILFLLLVSFLWSIASKF